MRHLWLFALVSTLAAAPAWSYTCNTDSRPMSTPNERFKDNGNGTLTDIQSGLTWMRCSLGQTWNGNTCTGEPRGYSWQGAQDEALKLNKSGGYGSYSDWRLPHMPELAMIIERQCADPRINLSLFPATPPQIFLVCQPGTQCTSGSLYVELRSRRFGYQRERAAALRPPGTQQQVIQCAVYVLYKQEFFIEML